MPKERKEVVRIELRLPPELHAEIVAAAKADERSMNAEMIVVIREGLAALKKRG